MKPIYLYKPFNNRIIKTILILGILLFSQDQIFALNSSVKYSEAIINSPTPPPPGPVANPATNITNTAFRANWDVYTGAISYMLDVSTSNTFATFITGYKNLSVSTNYKDLTGLLPNTTYYYRVRAALSDGSAIPIAKNVSNIAIQVFIPTTSAYSFTIATTTLAISIPPGPVVKPATNITNTSFRANWIYDPIVVEYKLDVSTSSTFATFIPGFNNLSIINSFKDVTGLTPDTIYYYRVRAILGNAIPMQSVKDVSNTKLQIVTPGTLTDNSLTIEAKTLDIPLSAPIAKAASCVDKSSFYVNWIAATGAAGYVIDISTVSDFSSFVGIYHNLKTSTLTGNATSGMVNSSITPDTTYYYRLRTENGSVQSVNSNVMQVLTLLNPPAILPVTNDNGNSFTVNWSSLPNAIEYHLDVSTDINFSSILQGYKNLILTNTYKTINDLPTGIAYYYRVKAICVSNQSSYSATGIYFKDIASIVYSPSELLYTNRVFDKSLSIPGTIGGSIDVSPSGAATYSMPITVSPGSHGMQPNLGIVYSSQSGNDIIGLGWHLSGLSAISRTNKSPYYDNTSGPIAYSINDALSLDGARLILTGTNTYSPENDPYTKVVLSNNIFTVTTKDGMVMEYGNPGAAASGSYNAQFLAQSSSTPYVWAINKITDPDKNYIEFLYVGSNTTGEYHINEINYTGNSSSGAAPFNSVKFYYAKRSDIGTGYIAGNAINQTSLLTSIKVYAENVLANDYEFAYFNDGQYSKLNQVSYTSNGIAYNPTIINWGKADYSTSPVVDAGLGSLYNNKLYFGDFNGDGKTEVSINCNSLVPSNSYSYSSVNYISHTISYTFIDAIVTDWNGDGKDELMVHYKERDIMFYEHEPPSPFCTNTGTQRIENDIVDIYNINGSVYTKIDTRNVPLTSVFDCTENSSTISYKYYYADLNNDGRIEQLTIQFAGSPNGTITDCYNIIGDILNININNVSDVKFLDFDGDGQTEILVLTTEGYGSIWKYNGTTFIRVYGDGTSTYQFGEPASIQTGDFNGDGKTDLLTYKKELEGWFIIYSMGTGFKPVYSDFIDRYFAPGRNGIMTHSLDNGVNWKYEYAVSVLVSDLNNDGKSDIIMAAGKYCIMYISEKKDFFSTHYFPNSEIDMNMINNVQVYAIDIDGNGQTEIIYGNDDLPFTLDWNGVGPVVYSTPVHENYRKFSFNTRLDQSLYVNSITDGLNNTSTINYSTFKDNTTAQKTWPIRVLRGPMQVASNITTTNGGKTWSNTNYTYNDGAFAVGRGFLGFSTFTASNSINVELVTSNFLTSNYNATIANSTGIYYTWLASQSTKKNGTDISLLENTTMTFQGGDITKKLFLPLITSSKTTDKRKNISVTNNIVNFNAATGLSGDVKSTTSDNQVTETVYTYEQVPSISSNVYRPNQIVSTSTIPDDTYTNTNTFAYGNSSFPLRLTSQTSQGIATTSYTAFDPYGNVKSISVHVADAYGTPDRNTSSTYDAYGRFVLTSTDVAGLTSSAVYRSSDGAVISKTDPNGLVAVTSYPTGGNSYITTSTLPDGNIVTNTLAWDVTGAGLYYTQKQLSNGPTSTTYYNAGGQKVKETSNRGLNGALLTSTYIYNTDGTLNTLTTPGNVITTYGYKTDGRLGSEINNINGTSTNNLTYSYPPSLNKVTVNDNISGQTKTQTFDDLGKLKQIIGTTGQIIYSYRASGKLSQVVTGGSTTSMTYDPLTLDQLSLTDPDAGTTSYTYNGFGQLKTQTDAKGQQTSCIYDNSGKLTQKTAPGINESYTYLNTPGLKGFLGSVTRNDVSETYGYDALGRTQSITTTGAATPGASASNFTTTYTYYSSGKNGAGQVASIAYPTGLTVNNIYDLVGNLKQINNADGGAKIWSGDFQNVVEQWTQYSLGNNLITKWGYDAKFMLNSIKTGTSGNETSVQNLGFTFNNFGQLTNRSEGTLSETFTYNDGMDRLTSAQVGTGPLYSYNYQPNGNIDNTTLAGKYTYDLPAHPHAVSNIDGPAGSTGQYPLISTTTDFDAQNKILKIDNTLNKDEFVYGTDGNRFRVDFNTSGSCTLSKVYIGNSEFGYNASNTQIYKRTIIHAPTGVCAVYEDNCAGLKEIYYIHTDYLGSWLDITNSTGSLTNKYSYDAWGCPRNPATWELLPVNTTDALASLNAMQPRFDRGYTGHETMAGFGLINMNGRLYDPYLQRFLSADNYVQAAGDCQSYNRYTYCLNNPFRYTDPSGYTWLSNFGKWVKKTFDNFGQWLTDNNISFQVGYSTSGFNFSGTPYAGASYNGANLNVGYNIGTGKVGVGATKGGFTNFWYPNYNYTSPEQIGANVVAQARASYFASVEKPVDWSKLLASHIRNSINIPGSLIPNPFFRADAIFLDGGFMLAGSEGDVGVFFILSGEEAGSIIPYPEVAGGFGSSADVGVEIGRIDYTGDPNEFKSEYLFDVRNKIYGGLGEGFSLGGSFAWGEEPETNHYIFETGVSLSFGISLLEPLTLGYNYGKKKP